MWLIKKKTKIYYYNNTKAIVHYQTNVSRFEITLVTLLDFMKSIICRSDIYFI